MAKTLLSFLKWLEQNIEYSVQMNQYQWKMHVLVYLFLTVTTELTQLIAAIIKLSWM